MRDDVEPEGRKLPRHPRAHAPGPLLKAQRGYGSGVDTPVDVIEENLVFYPGESHIVCPPSDTAVGVRASV